MVTTPHYDLDIDTTLGGNNASDYVIPSQKAIKSYVDNTSTTVDQTFDSTSANAQSGVAIAGELSSYATQLWAQQQSGLLFSAMQTWVQNQGYTTNVGTVTSVNNTSPDANGNVTLSIPTNYVQATNGNTAYTNTGTEATMGYTDTNAGEMYGVLTGYTYYGTGVILGAQSSTGGYLASITTSGLSLTNGAGMKTAALTVDSSNNLLVNGTGIADTDLSNLSATGKTVIDGQWEATSQAVISSNTSLNGSTNLTYRIDLPNDNQKYEVMLRAICTTNSTSGNEVALLINGNEDTSSRYVCRARAAQPGTWYCSGTVICVMSYVASNQKNLTVTRSTGFSGNCTELRAIAYRRIGTNV